MTRRKRLSSKTNSKRKHNKTLIGKLKDILGDGIPTPLKFKKTGKRLTLKDIYEATQKQKTYVDFSYIKQKKKHNKLVVQEIVDLAKRVNPDAKVTMLPIKSRIFRDFRISNVSTRDMLELYAEYQAVGMSMKTD